MPYTAGADSNRTRAGSVAGARTDQNTYTLDGVDVSDNVVGDNFLEALPSAIVPLPTESVEEFSAASTNANATFGRGSGAQFVIVTKRGTNRFKGSTYWYHQDDALNANSWDRQPARPAEAAAHGQPRAAFRSAARSCRTRRSSSPTTKGAASRGRRRCRAVPTDSLQAGILQFRDAAGNIVSYNLRATRSARHRPQSGRLEPVGDLLPGGNDPSRGDGFNTTGFTGGRRHLVEQDTVVLRLDHNFSNSWRVDGNYRFGSIRETGAAQADIGGLLPGNTKGVPVALEDLPREPRFAAVGVTGQLSPRLLGTTASRTCGDSSPSRA